MDESTRARFCLLGPLPAGTWELVFEPSFQHVVGLRLAGAHVEVRTGSSLFVLELPDLVAVGQRALETPIEIPPRSTIRDGMKLFVRTPTGSGELHVELGVPWRAIAAEVVAVIVGARQLPPKIERRVEALAKYL